MSDGHLDAELWDHVLEDDGVAPTVQAHLASCSRCSAVALRRRRVVELLKETEVTEDVPQNLEADVFELVRLDHVAQVVRDAALAPPPPAHLEEAALSRALQDTPVAPVVTPAGGWGRRTGAGLLAAAAVAAALFAITSYRQVGDLRERVKELQVASGEPGVPDGHDMQLVSFDPQQGSADLELVHFRHDNYKFLLRTRDLAVTPPGNHYELWLVGRGGDVSAGSFRIVKPDDITFSFQIGVDPKAFPDLVVTVEKDDGDPARSGRVLMRGVIDPQHVDH